MNFEKDDYEKLKKLGVENLIDLALIAPVSYNNLFIQATPNIGFNNVIDATIISSTKQGKILKLYLYAHNFDMKIQGVIFNPRYFHQKHFLPGARLFLQGKIENSFQSLQILQPQIIDEINKIIPKYKTPLQNKTVISLMQKYITKENFPTLHDIHFPSVEFVKEFEKSGFSKELIDELKYKEILNHLQKLSSKKIDFASMKKLTNDITPFINSLPFKLTNDQLKAIEEIKRDFQSNKAAKRVIMGDVGCGKTMVILAAVMLSYPNRSILMAPTTILAAQIYEEAKKYLKDLKICFVSSKSEVVDLKEFDFIIGTHALLYKDLPSAPLVMVDEQHRFGTKQRNLITKLISKGDKRPHFLQFSATPIPRTLSLIQSSIIDVTTIKELPFKKDIQTKIVSSSDFKSLINHVDSEIKKNNQIIIVYPLVQESETIEYQSIQEAKGYWQDRYKNVYVTFGKDREKESILEDFRDKGDILIATTLIEVGISLPRLSTIVIVAPERLGLATLHQLRGRVSRTGLKGYCYLFTKIKPSQRLKEFSKTLDGFEIAELDLKYRQGGDLLSGDVQSGKSFRWFDPKSDIEILKKAKQDVLRRGC